MVSAFFFAAACGGERDRPFGPGDGYGDALDDAAGKDQKSDQVAECGDDACEPALCGYDCTVLFYGCELWDFTGSDRQGLQVRYSEIFKGAFTSADPPSDKGYEFDIYTTPFQGPGTYPAAGFLSQSSSERRSGNYYRAEDACTIKVEAAGDGLAGTFDCPSLPNHGDETRSISLSGSFACGANALSTIIISLPEE